MSIALFLVVLIILILVHEFGHFIVAKRCGVRVDEFGIGFPPKLFGKKIGETEYTINALPFGGFVKIFGENAEEGSREGLEAERSLIRKSKLIQGAVIVAGVFFNILLGWFLFSLGFMIGLPLPVSEAPLGAEVQNVSLLVTGTESSSPAEEAGLKAGDTILTLQSGENELSAITVADVQSFIGSHANEEIIIGFRRGEEEFTKTLIPKEGIIPDRAAIGVSMDLVGTVKLQIHRAIWEGGKLTVAMTGAIIVSFANLIVDALSGAADLSGIAGPVGIVGLVGQAAEFGFVYLLSFVAVISINLAVLNLIPFPALDGGRLLFLFIEWIRGVPMNPRIVQWTHTAGFFLLIFLLLLITWSDVVKLLN